MRLPHFRQAVTVGLVVMWLVVLLADCVKVNELHVVANSDLQQFVLLEVLQAINAAYPLK